MIAKLNANQRVQNPSTLFCQPPVLQNIMLLPPAERRIAPTRPVAVRNSTPIGYSVASNPNPNPNQPHLHQWPRTPFRGNWASASSASSVMSGLDIDPQDYLKNSINFTSDESAATSATETEDESDPSGNVTVIKI